MMASAQAAMNAQAAKNEDQSCMRTKDQNDSIRALCASLCQRMVLGMGKIGRQPVTCEITLYIGHTSNFEYWPALPCCREYTSSIMHGCTKT